MSSTPFSVVVRSTIKPEHRDLFMQTMQSGIPAIRQLEGCIQVFMYEAPDILNKFIVFGTWESEALWRKHLQSDVAKQIVLLGDSITTDFSIQKLSLLNA